MPGASKSKPARSRISGDAAGSALEQTRAQLRRAGKVLHDDVGPLIGAAGLRLQLLRMDHPQAAAQTDLVLATLDDAMERIRALSQELSPSPFAAEPVSAARVSRTRPEETPAFRRSRGKSR